MKQKISLIQLEKELKKRWSIDYSWNGKKQNNRDDVQTKCVYSSPFFTTIQKNIEILDPAIQNYAWNRWYNFWSAKGVEAVFSQMPFITLATNPKDKNKDFYYQSIPFDHKTTVFPKGFGKSFEYAQKNPQEFVLWLYNNQSMQGRMHFKNRFFVVLYDSNGKQHWKIKACLPLLHRRIHQVFKNFSMSDCISFTHNGKKRYAGIIWVAVENV